MPSGILIFGANGSGKSTLARELASDLNLNHIDHEAYAFRESAIPYSDKRSYEECVQLMLNDINLCNNFVISAVTGDFGDEIVGMYVLAVLLTAPIELRLDRIRNREKLKYGKRVFSGGDMFESHIRFIDFVANRNLTRLDQFSSSLKCPLICLEGGTPILENIDIIKKYLAEMRLHCK